MIDVTTMAAQGDVLFRRIDTLPDGLTAVPDDEAGGHVVAHSETGHHHRVRGEDGARVCHYRPEGGDGLVSYLVLEGGATVTHERPWDTHAPLRLGGGAGAVWEVRRQREYTPEGLRRVED